MTWIGKVLNPCFLLFLGILLVVALVSPGASISSVSSMGNYATQPFLTGFLDGYNTMDALAGLAFGIIVVQVIQGLGVKEPKDVAGSTVRSGIFSCLLMAVIYLAVAIVGTQSRGLFPAAENGGIALAQIAQHYLRGVGLLVLAATVTLACLKTSVALITSCSETFVGLFPKGPSYRVWAIVFCLMSFVFANLGLSTIISYAVPVLMFLYPLAIAPDPAGPLRQVLWPQPGGLRLHPGPDARRRRLRPAPQPPRKSPRPAASGRSDRSRGQCPAPLRYRLRLGLPGDHRPGDRPHPPLLPPEESDGLTP